MKMTKKTTVSAILFAMYEQTRRWECEGQVPVSIPPIFRDRYVMVHKNWVVDPQKFSPDIKSELPLNYDEYEFFVKEILKLTTQKRIVRERWNEMKKYGILQERGNSGRHFLQLNRALPMFGEPFINTNNNEKPIIETEKK